MLFIDLRCEFRNIKVLYSLGDKYLKGFKHINLGYISFMDLIPWQLNLMK